MKKLLFLLPLLLALLSCTPPGSPAPGPGGGHTPGAPSHVNIQGAKALFLTSSASPNIVPRGISRSVTGGGQLHELLTDNSTQAATFTDAQGATVDITLTRTLQLDADYLLIDYGSIAIVALSTGTLSDLAVTPDSWDHIRVKAGIAYYVSAGALQRLNLATMAATDISQGDRISSDSLLFLDPSGNVHTFYYQNGNILDGVNNQVRTYFADGRPIYFLGYGNPSSFLFFEDATSTTGGRAVLEDEATGNVYQVGGYTYQGFLAQPIIFTDTDLSYGTTTVYDASFMPTDMTRPSVGKAFLDNVAFTYPDGGQAASLDISAGAISAAHVRVLPSSFYLQPTCYSAGNFYAVSTAGITEVEMASGAQSTPITATGITDFEVLADQIFYSTPSGVYQYDSVSTTTAVYSGPIVDPVTE